VPQRAFDERRPNARLNVGDRVVATFRLYQIIQPTSLVAASSGILDTILSAPARLTQLISPTSGPLVGRRLVKEYRFVLILEQLFKVPELRTHFSYTHGSGKDRGYFIDTPVVNAKGVTRFRLAGRTHRTPVIVNGVPVDGDSAFKEFSELIDDLFFPGDGTTTADYELYWLNHLAAISAEDPFGEFEWLIHPVQNGVTEAMNARRPFTRQFSLDFYGLRSNRDLAKAEDGFLAGLLSRGFLKTLLDKLGLGKVDLAGLLDKVFGAIGRIRTFLQDVNNLVTVVTDYINGVRDFIRYGFGKVRGLFDQVQEIIGRIDEAIDLVRDIPNLVEEQIDLLRQSFPGIVETPDNGILAVDEARNLKNFLAALVIQPQAFEQRLTGAPELPQTIAIQVPPAATLEELARGANVDPGLILQANNLRFPFVDPRTRPERIEASATAAIDTAMTPGVDPIEGYRLVAVETERALAGAVTQGNRVDTPTLNLFRAASAAAASAFAAVRAGERTSATAEEFAALEAAKTAAASLAAAHPSEPHVLYLGDPVRIPQSRRDLIPSVVGVVGARLNAIVSTTGEPITEEERLFGIDLLLDGDGNLEWDGARRDLALSRGLENIARAQQRYLALPYGALRFAPGIGNYAWLDIAEWQSPERNQLLAFSVFKTLSQDPRVRKVRDVRAVSRAGVALVEYDAELINGREVPELRAPLELANAA
jgi:hypothetical protein